MASAPGAPTSVTATAGDRTAIVSWTPPDSDGGSAIILYTVRSSPGGVETMRHASPVTVTGLTNGTEYTFTVTATNTSDTSASSEQSNPVTPVAAPVAPGAPTWFC